jgi:hypothetical protein
MTTASDPSLRVLHALRLKSFAPVDVVAEVAEVHEADAVALLETFRDKEWVRHRDGRITGWMLLTAGRTEGERMLADELDAVGGRDDIHAAYRQFLALNQACLQVCTDWQLVERDGAQVINDHDDPAHDADVIGRLRALGDEVQPICAELATVLARFGTYGPRFAAAVRRVEGGDPDWFTKPTIDSFHTVWFELHENLLATLGIERGTEERS